LHTVHVIPHTQVIARCPKLNATGSFNSGERGAHCTAPIRHEPQSSALIKKNQEPRFEENLELLWLDVLAQHTILHADKVIGWINAATFWQQRSHSVKGLCRSLSLL